MQGPSLLENIIYLMIFCLIGLFLWQKRHNYYQLQIFHFKIIHTLKGRGISKSKAEDALSVFYKQIKKLYHNGASPEEITKALLLAVHVSIKDFEVIKQLYDTTKNINDPQLTDYGIDVLTHAISSLDSNDPELNYRLLDDIILIGRRYCSGLYNDTYITLLLNTDPCLSSTVKSMHAIVLKDMQPYD